MGHGHTPPQLPEVTDEAGNTPRWVPLLGALLFAGSVILIAIFHGGSSEDAGEVPAAEAPAADDAH